MNQEQVIALARDAGFAIDSSMEESIILIPQGWTFFSLNAAMQKFANLVAEATKEKAAKVCEELCESGEDLDCGHEYAAAIRSMK